MPTDAQRWFDYEMQQPEPFPMLKQGDFGLVMSNSTIGRGIANRVGRRGHVKKLSHVFMYDKRGTIAHSTMPHGGRASLRDFLGPRHETTLVRIDGPTDSMRRDMMERMVELGSRPYDKGLIFWHYLDWWVESLTWSDEKGKGWRPFAKLIKNSDKSNVCSEALERVWYEFTGEKFQDADPGDARPLDVWDYCFAPLQGMQRGQVAAQAEFGRMIAPQRWRRAA